MARTRIRDSEARKFSRDLSELVEEFTRVPDLAGGAELKKLARRLRTMNRVGRVKINHSIMELILGRYLLDHGYSVSIEVELEKPLVCDLYATKGDGSMIVEVETGYSPPDHALDPDTYNRARIVSKIARYSRFASKFAMGFPVNVLMPIPAALAKPPRDRSDREIIKIKDLCDRYYENPPISISQILEARLHSIFLIEVDQRRVNEVDPERYLEVASNTTRVFAGG